MRLATLVLVGVLGCAAIPLAARAAPALPAPAGAAASNLIEVREGCGPGYRPEGWRDAYGYWHRRCVPEYGYREYYRPRYEWRERGYGWPEPRGGWDWR